MNLLNKIIRTLFLVKEITSKEGAIHFRRYRLISTPWFNLYIHNIRKSDEDHDPHDHPWDFASLILKGSYKETAWISPKFDRQDIVYLKYLEGDLVHHKAEDVHQITLLTPEVWTLVLTTGRAREWGYQTKTGWIDHKTYRFLKNSGQLP